MVEWEKVYTTAQLHQAEIVKSLLEEGGLAVVLLNKQDSNYNIGTYELYVPLLEAWRAVTILSDDIQL